MSPPASPTQIGVEPARVTDATSSDVRFAVSPRSTSAVLHAISKVYLARRCVTIKFSNTGLVAVVFQVR